MTQLYYSDSMLLLSSKLQKDTLSDCFFLSVNNDPIIIIRTQPHIPHPY